MFQIDFNIPIYFLPNLLLIYLIHCTLICLKVTLMQFLNVKKELLREIVQHCSINVQHLREIAGAGGLPTCIGLAAFSEFCVGP